MGKKALIIDQSEIIRKGLLHILRSFGYFASIHESDGSSAAESMAAVKPELVIIGLLSPGADLIYNKVKRAAGRNTKFVAIADHVTENIDLSVFDEILQLNAGSEEIRNKIEKIIHLKGYPLSNDTEDILSSREKEVIKLLAGGLTNREISEKLFISPHTVITHRKNITRKLDIRSVAGLVVYAILNDIVKVEDLQK